MKAWAGAEGTAHRYLFATKSQPRTLDEKRGHTSAYR
jgi:hypothetical protein